MDLLVVIGGNSWKKLDVTPFRESFMDFYNDGGLPTETQIIQLTGMLLKQITLQTQELFRVEFLMAIKLVLTITGDELGGSPRNTMVRRFSTNSHNWYGGISKLKINTDNFRYELGVDLRSYAGYHYRGISDFIGLDGFVSTANEHVYSNGSKSRTYCWNSIRIFTI